MSRKGVITKRVKTGPDGSIEKPRQPCRAAGRGTNVPRRPNPSVLKSRPKFKSKSGRVHITTREAMSRGRPPQPLTMPRTTMPREPGSNASRPRNLLTYRGRWRPIRKATPHVRPKSSTVPIVPRAAMTRLSGRSSRRPSERRGRPEARFEAHLRIFSPA
ncbi:unnamed protein product [Microthlaspi erraticum]|uniref:Uncharacterized protein n=1 Tax=Microthlaspi erraticum TaxID=1685480 RepID=A0A6D2HVI3_9BRAS|nr:unnamed protein product [Microthlaspi erraticum]